MAIRSVSLDDDADDDLCVFSGEQLLTAHYDIADLDWAEVAERSMLDERRGLVIAQVAVLEDLLDELILYLVDPIDVESETARLRTQTIGPRIDRLEHLLTQADLMGGSSSQVLDEMRKVVRRRNELAHGTLHWRPVDGMVTPITQELVIEWVLSNRRSGETRRVTMSGLRGDLDQAIGCFSSLLVFAEELVERAATPRH